MLETLVYVLTGLNIAQFAFWSYQNQKLVDKLMSRNYAEYVQASGFKPEPKQTIQIPPDNNEDVLKELNGMLI